MRLYLNTPGPPFNCIENNHGGGWMDHRPSRCRCPLVSSAASSHPHISHTQVSSVLLRYASVLRSFLKPKLRFSLFPPQLSSVFLRSHRFSSIFSKLSSDFLRFPLSIFLAPPSQILRQNCINRGPLPKYLSSLFAEVSDHRLHYPSFPCPPPE